MDTHGEGSFSLLPEGCSDIWEARGHLGTGSWLGGTVHMARRDLATAVCSALPAGTVPGAPPAALSWQIQPGTEQQMVSSCCRKIKEHLSLKRAGKN